MSWSCQSTAEFILFHVSCLKKALRQQVTPSLELPPLDDEGKLSLEPEVIIDVKEKKLRNNVIPEHLVKWKNLPLENAILEGVEIFEHPNLKLLEGREDYHIPLLAGRSEKF